MDGDPTMIELEGPKRTASSRRIQIDLQREENKSLEQQDTIHFYDDLGDIPMLSPTTTILTTTSISTSSKMVQQSVHDTTALSFHDNHQLSLHNNTNANANESLQENKDYDHQNKTNDRKDNKEDDNVDESFHSVVKQPETPPPIRRLIDTTTPSAIIPVSMVHHSRLPTNEQSPQQEQQQQQSMMSNWDFHNQDHDMEERNDEELEQIHANLQNENGNNNYNDHGDDDDDASTSARQCDDDAQEINRVRTIRDDVSKHQHDQNDDTTSTTTTTFDDNHTVDATMNAPVPKHDYNNHDHHDTDDEDDSLLRGTPTEFDDNTTMDTSVNSNLPVVDLASDGISSFLLAASLAMEEAVCGSPDEDSLLDQSSIDDRTEITEFDDGQEDDTDQESMQRETLDTWNEKNTLSNVLLDKVVSIGMGVIAAGAAVGAAFDPPKSTTATKSPAKEKYAASNYPSEELRQDQEHDIPSEHFNSRTVSTKSRYCDNDDRSSSQDFMGTATSDDYVDIDNDEVPVDSENYHDGDNIDNDDNDHVDYDDDDIDDDDDNDHADFDDNDSSSDLASASRVESPSSELNPLDGVNMIPTHSLVKSDYPRHDDFATRNTERLNNLAAENDRVLMVRAQMTDELNRLFREVELYEMGVNIDDEDTYDYGPPKLSAAAPIMSPKGQWNDSVKPGNEPDGADIDHCGYHSSLTTQDQYPKGKFDDDPTLAIVTGSVTSLGGALYSYRADRDDGIQSPKTFFDEDPAMSENQESAPSPYTRNNMIDDNVDLENPPPLQFHYPGMAIHNGKILTDSCARPDMTDATENDMTVIRDACHVVGYDESSQSFRKAQWTRKISNVVDGGHPYRRRRCILICVTILLTLVILILTIGFGSGSFGGGKKNDSSIGAIGGPVLSIVPTSAPTLNAEERSLAFAKIFMSITMDGGRALNDTSSPEFLAYNWIVNQDVSKLDPSDLSTKNQMRIVQRYGLSTLYFNSAKTSWANESKWLSMNECAWFGVTCGASDEVVGINMFNNLLVGTLSHDIATLTNLEELNLSTNKIGGVLPASIASMKNLRILAVQENSFSGDLSGIDFAKMSNLSVFDCRRNSFNGKIPEALYQATLLSILALDGNSFSGSFVPEISNLVALERFTASRNSFNGTLPTSIGLLTSLQILRLGENKFSGTIPTEIGTMSGLTSFDIFLNAFKGVIPTEIGMLTQLQYLFLSRNSLEGRIPSELGLTDSLLGFFVNDNRLTGTIPFELGKHDKLQMLRLGKNSFTSGPFPSFLYQMTSLTELHMYGMNMTGNFSTELGNLNLLSSLRVEGNLFTGRLPREVSLLTNLTELIVSANALTGSIPSSIGSLTLLEDLRLDQNRFFGLLPDVIGNMVLLETLQFDNNLLFGQLPDTLTNLVNVKVLYCGDNQLSGTFPENFGNLVALEDFQCFHNAISQSRQPGIGGTLPTSLGKMTNLKKFVMYQNGLKGTIPSAMGEMSSLVELDVEWNMLSGTIPSELGNLSNLDILHLGANDFVDPLPLSLCSLSLDAYTVDCNMTCSCCTTCGARLENP